VTEQHGRRDRYRSVKIGGVVAALLAGGYLVYDNNKVDYNAVCANKSTSERVDDAKCRDTTLLPGTGLYNWYHVPTSNDRYIPPVGQRLDNGSFNSPTDGKVSYGGAPTTGGKVSRGGFGSSSTGSGTVGG
jgi:hypothetical protein